MSDDCLFCRLAAGQVPAVKICEDDETLAFMDIGPIVKGHVLVIPKRHYDPLMQTPDEVLARVIATVRRVAEALRRGLQADGVNVFQANGATAGQVVPHLHFHVIPRFRNDGHRWNWAAGKYAGPDEMRALAGRIKAAL